jgi:putative endonuclease
MSGCWFYILWRADGSYYAGTSRSEDMETRIGHHNQGYVGGSTTKRRPVTLVYSSHFDSIADAIAYERQVGRLVESQEGSLDKRRFRSSSRIVEKLSLAS